MRVGVSQSEIANCITEPTIFADGVSSCVADHAGGLNLKLLLDENGNQLRHVLHMVLGWKIQMRNLDHVML
uniref:Uncharacterized protein n=1 Tax=Salix viminalis TaxID=40686 RepID=A0A6N2KYG6_SALVM